MEDHMLKNFKTIAALSSLITAQTFASCGITDDLVQGNQTSKKLFNQFVVKDTLVGQPTPQIPSDYVTAEQYGANGNDQLDDTYQLRQALSSGKKIWLAHNGIYRINKKIQMPANTALVSDGTATILMQSGPSGFSNSSADRSSSGIYGDAGTGIEVGGNNVIIQDLFIVKEYEDNRYVIAISVSGSSNVLINRIAVRGFSIAPGIITIAGSPNFTLKNSIIHNACTQSTTVPNDLNAFQISGVVVDDNRPNGVASNYIKLDNNVIIDLIMKANTSRGDQSDGINFAGSNAGLGAIVSNNYVNGVAEGLDLFGTSIKIFENLIGAREQSIKIIHQANNIEIYQNHIAGKPSIGAINIWNAQSGESVRPNNIKISDNLIDTRYTSAPGLNVEAYNGYSSPYNITVLNNTFSVNACNNTASACDARQCSSLNNNKFHEGVFTCP